MTSEHPWIVFVASGATVQTALAYLAIKRTDWTWYPMLKSQGHGLRVAYALFGALFTLVLWTLALATR